MSLGSYFLRGLSYAVLLGAVMLVLGWAIFGSGFSYVQIHGRLSGPEREVVAQAIRDSAKDSLFVTPKQVAEAVADLGWTTGIQVWRKSRERVVVVVKRKDLAASVDEREFITVHGELVSLPNAPGVMLPQIDTSHLEVQRALDVMGLLQGTGDRLGLELLTVSESPGVGWRAAFSPGFDVVIGGTDLVGRLERFGVVFKQALDADRNLLLRIDARYDRGVAVTWKPDGERQVLASRGDP